jgi:DNA-binding transcriptional LysR family regulator
VAAGLGVAVLPGLAAADPLPGVEVRKLGSAAPVRQISAGRPRDAYHGPAVTAMLDCLRATAQAFAIDAD